MKTYEINSSTAAVIGIGENSTKIVEKENNYIINNNSFQIMEDSCSYFGSSYEGRVIGAKNMIGNNYKVPIIVEETNELIFFPLSEITNSKCTWIALKWFDRVENDNENIFIYLKNGKRLTTKVSKYVVENQVLRATKLIYNLNERKKV